VVPPAPGQRTSFLVVGTYKSASLLVLSLPDAKLVHTHVLEGMQVGVRAANGMLIISVFSIKVLLYTRVGTSQVFGLAADTAGTALVVVDGACGSTHLLPWPLPGMQLT
jgi:hypothetical protein